MLEGDLVRRGVEINEVAGADIDRADAKAHLAGIDAVEIDQRSSVALSGVLS